MFILVLLIEEDLKIVRGGGMTDAELSKKQENRKN